MTDITVPLCDWDPDRNQERSPTTNHAKRAQVIAYPGAFFICRECADFPKFKDHSKRDIPVSAPQVTVVESLEDGATGIKLDANAETTPDTVLVVGRATGKGTTVLDFTGGE